MSACCRDLLDTVAGAAGDPVVRPLHDGASESAVLPAQQHQDDDGQEHQVQDQHTVRRGDHLAS